MNASVRISPTLPALDADRVARLAQDCLRLELRTFPKPGLVSHVDRGAHRDMDAHSFERSAAAIQPFLARLADAGAALRPMPTLRRIGLEAEAAMLSATGGVNTHRGAIFCLGLLCAAAGASRSGSHAGRSLGEIVALRWGNAIEAGPIPLRSHGSDALRRHGASGARGEAMAGFPSLYRIGLPALRAGARLRGSDPEAARVQCLFALIAGVQDTNLLHRGGAGGASFASDAAHAFLQRGGVGRPDWRDAATRVHRDFVARHLSPGGCADLLAACLFVDRFDTELAAA